MLQENFTCLYMRLRERPSSFDRSGSRKSPSDYPSPAAFDPAMELNQPQLRILLHERSWHHNVE